MRLNVSAASAAGARSIRCSTKRRSVVAFEVSRHRHRHPARRSRRSSSRRSSRPTPRPAANTAAPALASPSAANSPNLLGGEIQLRSTPGVGSGVHALPAAALCRPVRPRSAPRRRSDSDAAADVGIPRRRRTPGRADPGRPPGDRAGRHHPADRRGRPALCADHDRPRARQGLQGACSRCAAPTRSTSPSSTSRPRCRSTCSCPTCWAGTCSASSSRIR